MKQQGYYKQWLVPQLGCNEETVFKNRPVGNSPEFMPLDMSLNNDIQLSLSLYCAITSHLDKDDERKFLMATSKTIVKGLRRLWGQDGNVTSSWRIIHDCYLALRAFGVVYRAGGKMLLGLVNRSGHRNHAEGGKRKSGVELWLKRDTGGSWEMDSSPFPRSQGSKDSRANRESRYSRAGGCSFE